MRFPLGGSLAAQESRLRRDRDLTLALGIGSTTAIVSVVNAVIWHPVPGPHDDRVVQIGEHVTYGARLERAQAGMSSFVLTELIQDADLFSDLARADGTTFGRKSEDFVARVYAAAVSPNFFSMFGIRLLKHGLVDRQRQLQFA